MELMYYMKILILFTLTIIVISCSNEPKLSYEELLNKATKAMSQGNFEEAIKFSDEAIKVQVDDTSCSALITKSLAQELSKDIDNAIKTLLKAVKINPNSFLAQYNLGRLLYDSKHYGDSISHLTTANELDENHIDTMILLAQVYTKQELYDNAISFYKKLLRTDKYKILCETWNELGVLYLLNENKKNALKCFIKSVQLNPNNHISVFNIATMLDPIKPNYALKFYKMYCELIKNNPELMEQKAQVIVRMEELSK